jgi:hypothetical protein
MDSRDEPRPDRRALAPRTRRQHGEEVDVEDVAPPVSQLGGVADHAADPVADLRPAADGVGAHELADPERERHVGVQAAVDVPRRVVGGRRVSGPNGYPPPGLLERVHDPQEAIRQRRVHDEHGMDVGATDGWLEKTAWALGRSRCLPGRVDELPSAPDRAPRKRATAPGRIAAMAARTAARRLRIVFMRPTGVSAVSAGQALPSVSPALNEEATSS